MKRRKFLKLLALIPALSIACKNPFKPKSKPPPIERYDPAELREILSKDFFKFVQYHHGRIWASNEVPEGEVLFISKDPTLFPNMKYSTLQNIRKWG